MNGVHIMRNDLNLLVVFDAVFTGRSVTVAARQLSLSQSAVSHALNRLRDRMKDKLFVRSKHGLVPTPRAFDLAVRVRMVMVETDTIFSGNAFDPVNSSQLVRIATSDYASRILLPSLILALRQKAPNMRLRAVPMGPNMLEQLATGELDLAFWGAEPPPKPWQWQKLFDESYIGVVALSHDLARIVKRRRVTIKEYTSYPHVAVAMLDPRQNEIDANLRTKGWRREVAVSTSSFETNLQSLIGSDLITTIPTRLFSNTRAPGCVSFELPLGRMTFSYGMVWHDRTGMDAANTWLRNLIESLSSP
jgi:DNA-binding transcriptional LysR family regulator